MIDQNMLLRATLYSLAVIRVAYMFVYEDGPWDMFDYLRAAVGVSMSVKVTNNAEGTVRVETERDANTFFGKLLNCPLCLSVWFSAAAVIALYVDFWVFDVLAVWLAISCVSLIYFRDKTV